jgi:hypothetical protein
MVLRRRLQPNTRSEVGFRYVSLCARTMGYQIAQTANPINLHPVLVWRAWLEAGLVWHKTRVYYMAAVLRSVGGDSPCELVSCSARRCHVRCC